MVGRGDGSGEGAGVGSGVGVAVVGRGDGTGSGSGDGAAVERAALPTLLGTAVDAELVDEERTLEAAITAVATNSADGSHGRLLALYRRARRVARSIFSARGDDTLENYT